MKLKRLFHVLAATAAMALLSCPLFAQNTRTVSGKVSDETGSPLPGVYVVVKGTQNATMTDNSGNFSLNIPSSAKELVFSMIGMKELSIPIGNRGRFDVTMETDALGLDASVSIGYGTMIKRELSTSVASVDSDNLTQRATAFNIMQSLAGKVAGVRSTSMSGRPGGTTSMRIRGMGSINSGNDPIYVLDGVVDVDPSLINNNDIESIDILKDAAATAMYGSKGANGVVLITTKSGKSGQGTVTYDGKVGVSILTRKLDLLDADGFMEMQRRAYAYSGNVMPHLTTPMENLFYYQKDAAGNYVYDENGLLIASPKYDTDWQDEVTRNALVNDHSVSFSRGDDKTKIYASVSAQDVEGLLKTTYQKKLTGTINVNSKINDWWSIQALASGGSYEANKGDEENTFGQGALRNMIEMPPIVPVHYEDGTWGRKSDYPLGEVAENPIRLLNERKNIDKNNFLLLSLSNDIKLYKGLTLTVKGDYQTRDSENDTYAKAGLLDYTENNGGIADISNSHLMKWSNEDYLTYERTFFDDRLKSNFVLGASWYYSKTTSSSSGSENYFDDSFEYYNLGAGTTFHKPTSGYNKNTMNSYYFRMNHSWMGKYMLGATIRADGASNFGENNKYGYFPSVSGAWAISEEPFFEPLTKYISHLKLRMSYGAVGNASIPNYRTFSQFSNNSTIFNKELQPYVLLSNLGNNDLKWESSKQFDVGLDISLLNDRIEIITDFYDKKTTDLLFQKQVPYTTGYSNSWTNLGQLTNRGFELTITSHNISNSNFSWDTDLVFSTNKIIVDDINGETIDLGNNLRAVEGEAWGSYYIYNRIGTWGLDEVAQAAVYGKKPGDLKYEDVNGDGVIGDADLQNFGSAQPKGEVSLVNTINWKGFTFMLDLGALYGFKVMDITQAMLENRQLYSNSVSSVLDAWTPEHQNTLVAAIRRPSDIYWGENEKDTRMLYKGDFIRVRNIMASYDFKQSLLKNVKLIKGLSLGVIVENPFIFTEYPGYDPEVGAFGNADTSNGIDFYAYPKPMTISGNLKITF